MNYEKEKRTALNHALVSSKLKILIKLFDNEDPKSAVTDLGYALELFRKKYRESSQKRYY